MYGVGPSYQLVRRQSYTLAPVLELVSWHVFGGQTGSTGVVQSAGTINVLNAKLGARVSFSDGSSIDSGYGRGLTSEIWYRNLFRIEYRRVFQSSTGIDCGSSSGGIASSATEIAPQSTADSPRPDAAIRGIANSHCSSSFLTRPNSER